jgi:hypothetical protein
MRLHYDNHEICSFVSAKSDEWQMPRQAPLLAIFASSPADRDSFVMIAR